MSRNDWSNTPSAGAYPRDYTPGLGEARDKVADMVSAGTPLDRALQQLATSAARAFRVLEQFCETQPDPIAAVIALVGDGTSDLDKDSQGEVAGHGITTFPV